MPKKSELRKTIEAMQEGESLRFYDKEKSRTVSGILVSLYTHGWLFKRMNRRRLGFFEIKCLKRRNENDYKA